MSRSSGPRLRLEFWRGLRQSMASRSGITYATAVAAARVDELLATHRPEPLPAPAQSGVDAVLARAMDQARRS